jgi:hypothetical protein
MRYILFFLDAKSFYAIMNRYRPTSFSYFSAAVAIMKLLFTESLVPMGASMVLIISIFLSSNTPLGYSQVSANQTFSVYEGDRTFHSTRGKFNITVPVGWIIQETDNIDTYTLLEEMMQGSRLLAQICPKDQAIAIDERSYDCKGSNQTIYIEQYRDLDDQPEFASIADDNATSQDLLEYRIMRLQKLGYSQINVLNNTNLTISVIDSNTNNKTLAVVPANLVEMRYNSPNSTDTWGYFLLAITNATSNSRMVSGYSLSYEANAATLPSLTPPEPIVRTFQSFQFVKDAGGELSAPKVENNDYRNDTFNSTQSLTRYLEDLLPPSSRLQEQTNTNNTLS